MVGVPRSGTTLLAAMLAAHSRLDCGPETHFFERLPPREQRRILADPRWPEAATRFVTSIRVEQGRRAVHELFGQSEEEIHAFLSARSPTAAAMLESLTVPRASSAGKQRWVEKSTSHLAHLPRIRRAWPAARIVRIVRDPRDVALSLSRVPFGSQSWIANLYFWLERDGASVRFFESDQAALTIRYEDLVRDPEAVLGRVCAFMGEDYEPRMLETRTSAGRVATATEWYKQRAAERPDATRIDTWRRELTIDQARLAGLAAAEGLRRYGYEGSIDPVARIRVQPLARAFLERNERVVYRFSERSVRLEPWHAGRTRDAGISLGTGAGVDARTQAPLRVLWGEPGQLEWRLGKRLDARVRDAAQIVRFLVADRLAKRPVYWLRHSNALPRQRGVLVRACDLVARLVTVPVTEDAVTARVAGSADPTGG